MYRVVIPLTSEEKTIKFANGLFPLLRELATKDYLMLYITGDLGAGKSVFSRALIRSTGYTGNIPSPTYSLLESYQAEEINIHHLDLYRFGDFSELEMLGFYDFLIPNNLFLIEWPQILGDTFTRVIHLELVPDAQDLDLRHLHLSFAAHEIGTSTELEQLVDYVQQYAKNSDA